MLLQYQRAEFRKYLAQAILFEPEKLYIQAVLPYRFTSSSGVLSSLDVSGVNPRLMLLFSISIDSLSQRDHTLHKDQDTRGVSKCPVRKIILTES